MAPIDFGGDGIAEITFGGDDIAEVTMDGDVVWQAGDDGEGEPGGDWRADTTVLENFEGYGSQAELEAAWDFGVAPASYELNTSGAIAHEQDIRAEQTTAHAPNESIGTSWGETYSVAVVPGHTDNSPGLSVQHQPNWGSRLDDCYWCRADFQNGDLQVIERTNGATVGVIASDSFSTGLSTANTYRIQVDLRSSDNNVRARLYDFGENPGSTPHANTGYGSPGAVHSGGHIMLNSGRTGAGNAHFDNVRQH